MPARCKSCAWFDAGDDALYGECHIFPATMKVEPLHWCGQHKYKKKTDKPISEENESLNYKSLIKFYCEEFKRVYNIPYTVDWTKDTQAAKTLISEEGMEQAKKYVTWFVEHPPSWYLDKSAVFLRCLPKARTQMMLIAAQTHPQDSIELDTKYANNADWPDYVDYRRKGGKENYTSWSRNG